MRVSAKSDYALRALIELATREGGEPVSAEELGKLQEIPHGFLQAILADLRRAGVVMSQRGQSGGWRMARDAESVSVADVIRAVDGPLVSVDFNHNPASSIFDSSLTRVCDGTLVKVSSWYDNEWGFSNRMLDVAAVFAEVGATLAHVK